MIKKINIDITRFLIALCIVAIHVYPFVSFNETFDYMITRVLFRIGVPFFLMLTGYYILPKVLKNKQVLKEYTFKILKLYVISILIYLPINIYNGYFSHFEILTFIKDIFINGTFYHLWYFPALILGLWITYYCIKKFTFSQVICFAIFLYIIGLFGDSYYGMIKNTFLKNVYDCLFCLFDYTRNGLFYAPIFLYVGYYFSIQKHKITDKKNTYFLFLSFLTMMIEGFLLYYFHIPKHNSMYLFLLPLSYFFFEFLIKCLQHLIFCFPPFCKNV